MLQAPEHGSRASLLSGLPESARALFFLLLEAGPMTAREASRRSGIPTRTVRYAAFRLRMKGAIESVPSLRDARQTVLHVTGQKVEGRRSTGTARGQFTKMNAGASL
ncbi:MAG: hypothetical protein ACT4PT_09660 [Methanobacteriota archaeon]